MRGKFLASWEIMALVEPCLGRNTISLAQEVRVPHHNKFDDRGLDCNKDVDKVEAFLRNF